MSNCRRITGHSALDRPRLNFTKATKTWTRVQVCRWDGTVRAGWPRVRKQRSPELAIRTVVVSTAAAARMHMRLGNPRLAGEAVSKGMAMLDDVCSQLPAEVRESTDGLYQDGRSQLQQLADEAEASCSSARG